MKICLLLKLWSSIPPHTRYDRVYAPASTLVLCTRKKMISLDHRLLHAVNSLQLQPEKCDVIITSSIAMNI